MRLQKGKSSGLDNWSAEEVLNFPDEFWELAATCFAAFESVGFFPKEWSLLKQAHIPKSQNADREDTLSQGFSNEAHLRC